MITPYFLDLLRLRRNLKIIQAHHQHRISISSNSTQSDCFSSATGIYVLVAHLHFRPHGCQMNVQCTISFPLNQWTTMKKSFHVCVCVCLCVHTYMHVSVCVCVGGGGCTCMRCALYTSLMGYLGQLKIISNYVILDMIHCWDTNLCHLHCACFKNCKLC